MRQCFLCGRSERAVLRLLPGTGYVPCHQYGGEVVAFSGRDVTGTSKAKYLNSSDTPVFRKRKNLFALNFAKAHCAEQMILCEGNMDVVSMHAAGFENAVASLGTAPTDEQARIMARYTKQVIIAYDGDSAGQRAAGRAMDIFARVGLDVRVLRITDAKDPDEYIRKFRDGRICPPAEGKQYRLLLPVGRRAEPLQHQGAGGQDQGGGRAVRHGGTGLVVRRAGGVPAGGLRAAWVAH